MYNVPPAIAGDENIGQRFDFMISTAVPDWASNAYSNPVSEVPAYTFPPCTAAEPITHEPLLLNAHFFCPVLASIA